MIKISVGSVSNLLKRFFKQINSPYKVSIINEETLNEALVIHLTKKSVYIFLSSIFVGLFIIFSGIIFLTPLRFYLPGNSNNVSRKELLKIQKLSDSLNRLNNIREKYIFNLISVANGNIDLEKDTSVLTPSQIQQAILKNSSHVDHAKKYDYLKVKKLDTNNVENVGKKDSL